MTSSNDSFDEEGEIFDSEVEKAPPSLPSVTGPSVDRHSSRPLRHSSSPTDSSTSSRDHDRRDNGDSTSRGKKRHRSREVDDRRFKVHFDMSRLPARPQVSYADIDKTDPNETLRDERLDQRFRAKRSRTRSRTPPRIEARQDYWYPGRGGGRNDDRRRDDWGRGRDRYYHGGRGEYNRYENGDRRSRDRSLEGRRERPGQNDRSKRDAELRAKDTKKFSGRDGTFPRNGRPQSFRHEVKKAVSKTDLKKPEPKEDELVVEIEEPVDEAKLIEERRKKREAIKAKYRGQSTPNLLVSALTVEPSPAIASPIEEQKSPRTPASPGESTPAGSFDITKDEGTVHDGPGGEADEPSAADYDPTMDMEEDRNRDEQRLNRNEVSSGAYDEVKSTDRDVLMREVEEPAAEAEVEEKAEGGDDDFDMFAEVDDDDMFAPLPTKAKKDETTVAKAVPIVEAKQLDASLLDNWDDQEGYYKIIPGELLDNRYRVQTSLGKGMFSGVVRAFDMQANKDVAIKIIRNNETMRKAGMKEIDILTKICNADPEDKKHLVRLERHFEHKAHLCIVFENLNINLREVLKKSGIRDVGISLKAVRAYAQQMFLGLSLLRKCSILHADLKPDNVLVSESQNVLKICDLGSASDAADNEITPYLVSRFYRAPEIILGIPYDFAIDMWSIGCTLYELYTGKILFTGRTNNQMLRSVMECRGKFSNKLLRKGTFTALHFDEVGNFKSMEKDKITGRDIVRTMNITKPTRELKQRLLAAASGSETELKDLNSFIDLLEKCLNLNPERRCTPNEALKHPFFQRPVPTTK